MGSFQLVLATLHKKVSRHGVDGIFRIYSSFTDSCKYCFLTLWIIGWIQVSFHVELETEHKSSTGHTIRLCTHEMSCTIALFSVKNPFLE